MRLMLYFLLRVLAFLVCLLPTFTVALTESTPSDAYRLNPYSGRLTAAATFVNVGIVGGDVFLPIYGSTDGFLYADIWGDYGSNSTWLASPGSGWRQVVNNQIFSAYLFGDYEAVSEGRKFWVVNPGFEWISTVLDAHVNGYFPTQRSQESGATNFLSNFGDFSQVFFSGHNQFDILATPFVMIGRGVDAELGLSAPFHGLRGRFSVGGYYYMTPSDVEDIRGVTVGLNFSMTPRWNLIFNYSYDNLNRSAGTITLAYSIGKTANRMTADVRSRLVEQPVRHVGIIATGAGTYAQRALKVTGPPHLQYNNIWFFRPNAPGFAASLPGAVNSVQECTFERPCTGSTQTDINDVNGLQVNARFYLSGNGSYGAITEGSSFTFANGQSVYGRSNNYVKAAQGAERPLLQNTIFLRGNNMVDSVRVEGHTQGANMLSDLGPLTTQPGIEVQAAATGAVTIRNSTVTSANTTGSRSTVAVDNFSTANVDIRSSTLTGTNTQNDFEARGVYNEGSTLSINGNSTITVSSTGTNGYAYGVMDFAAASVLTVNDSTITVTATSGLSVRGFQATQGSGTINRSTINVTTTNDSGGNSAVFTGSTSGLVTINDSTISITGTGSADLRGITSGGADLNGLTLNNSTVSVNAGAQTGTGVFNNGTGVITIANSTITVTGAGDSVATSNTVGGTLTSTGTTCKVNGATVSCT